MIKIKSLTDEQKARFPEFVKRWTDIALCTARADRPKAEEAAKNAYKIVGLKAPDSIIWCDSPLSLAVVDNILKNKNLNARITASVKASVWDSVKDSIWYSVRASVKDSIWCSVRASVWYSARDSVRDSLGASVGASVRYSVRDSVRDSVYGQHEAGWLSFYSYFLEVCNLEVCKKLLPLMELAENAGWWIPRENIILLSERPIRCEINQRGRLHNSNGKMAIEYADGFGVYANDGVRLPEKYGAINASHWEPKWLLTETNAELRMCLIKNIGYDKIFHELGAQKIDAWREYELLKIENIDIEPIMLLKMVCPSTGKIHTLRVPPDTKKARQAITLCNQGVDPETFVVEH